MNDRCLYRGGTGVAMVLRNVLSHWPADAGAQPEGFYARWSGRPAADPGAGQGGEVRFDLKPLASLGAPERLGRRWPGLVRRVGLWVYGRAYRAEFGKGYAAAWEPNHLAVQVAGPTLATMHDLSVLEHPQWHPADRVGQWRRELPGAMAGTSGWITPSEFTKGRMVAMLGVEASRIQVIPLAARALPARARGDSRASGLPEKYLLHLGTLEPRKNIGVLLEAYGRWPAEARRRCRLVLAGPVGWGGREFWRGLVGHAMAGEVLAAGYAGEAEVAALLAGAEALVAPSHYEGFGLPLLEAMAAGTPVICSDIPAFREVAGEAAEFASPADADTWGELMARAAEDAAWGGRLAEAGRARCAGFSWEATGTAYAEAFARVAGGK